MTREKKAKKRAAGRRRATTGAPPAGEVLASEALAANDGAADAPGDAPASDPPPSDAPASDEVREVSAPAEAGEADVEVGDPQDAEQGSLPGLDEGSPPDAPATGENESDAEPDVEQARELSDTHLRGLLEALVFASDKPMKTGELARMASAPSRQVKEAMAELRAEYANRGIVLDEVAGGWLFRTNAQYAPFVRELAGGRPVKLTRAQIETLAIAAYRQPITRPEIDEIRGVDSGATLKLLLERDLIRILGKKDEPGRPLLYGTTSHFLEFFNMKSLKDLPTLREFTELSDESRRVAEEELGSDFEAPTASNDRSASDAPGADEASAGGENDVPVGNDLGDVDEAGAEAADEDEEGTRETLGPPPADSTPDAED